MTEYATPGAPGGDKLPLADLSGALLRIDVLEALRDVDTTFGKANPVRANVAVLDGEHKADTYDDTLIFPRVLVSQLAGAVGQVVVGRLGKGTAKAGQSAPWLLSAATGEDIAVAQKYDAFAAKKKAETEADF